MIGSSGHLRPMGFILLFLKDPIPIPSVLVQLIVRPQSRSQTSEQDEQVLSAVGASHLRGLGAYSHPPPLPSHYRIEILKSRYSAIGSFKHFPWHFSLEKAILGKCRGSLSYCYLKACKSFYRLMMMIIIAERYWCQVNDHLHFKPFKCCDTYYNNK